MQNHEQRPNWVAERAKCRLDLIFEALSQVIRRDVAEFNKLSADLRLGRTASVAHNGDGVAPSLRVYFKDEVGAESTVTFSQAPNVIAIKKTGCEIAFFGLEWHVKRKACLLTDNDGGGYEVWELSQTTLGPFLFQQS